MITVRSSSGTGSFDACTTGNSLRVPTSSRCIATSMTPVSISALSISRMKAAIRRAISTPRDGTPASTTLSWFGFPSIISCAIRRSARRIASASTIGTPAIGFCFGFTVSLATSRDRLKGTKLGGGLFGARLLSSSLSPVGAMFHDPIQQGSLKADVFSGFFALDPLVLQNFRALGEELLVEGRVSNELRLVVFRRRHLRFFFHKTCG